MGWLFGRNRSPRAPIDRGVPGAAERADPARRRSAGAGAAARHRLRQLPAPQAARAAGRPCRCASSTSTRRRWPSTANGRGRAPSLRDAGRQAGREGRRGDRLRRGVRRARPLVDRAAWCKTCRPTTDPASCSGSPRSSRTTTRSSPTAIGERAASSPASASTSRRLAKPPRRICRRGAQHRRGEREPRCLR